MLDEGAAMVNKRGIMGNNSSKDPDESKAGQRSAPSKSNKLAQRLRDNLKKRKQQIRDRGLTPKSGDQTHFRIDRDSD